MRHKLDLRGNSKEANNGKLHGDDNNNGNSNNKKV
jgi:hypothetical protein